jgi:DNA (cytosine-5)-methyltransferase 1
MLDEGLHHGLAVHGLHSRVVGYCERETYTANLLVDRMEAQALEPAPVFAGDLADIEWSGWVGRVDGFVGGIPCQPFSVAGQQRGTDDERWLWPTLWRAIRDSGAWFLAIENVAAFTLRGLDPLLCDLAEAGWSAEWGCIRASDVGAPHHRNRFFLLAVANPRRQRLEGLMQTVTAAGPTGRGGRAALGYAEQHRLGRSDESRGQAQGRTASGGAGGGSVGACMADANEHGRQGVEARRGGAGEQPRGDTDGRGLFPPRPGDRGAWAQVPPRAQPAICRVVDGLAFGLDKSRADRLRACGNGVVALQAAVAFAELVERLKR